jgi:predicted PurR-regulated permease PerM
MTSSARRGADPASRATPPAFPANGEDVDEVELAGELDRPSEPMRFAPAEAVRDTIAVPRWLRRGAAWGWRLMIVAALVYFTAVAIDYVRVVLVPLMLSLVVAAVLWPMTEWLTRHKCPRALAALLSVVSLVLLVLGVIAPVAIEIGLEASSLVDWVKSGWERVPEALVVIPGVDETAARDATTRIETFIESHSETLVGGVAEGATTTVSVITGTGFLLFFVFFFLKDGRRIRDFVVQYIPGPARWQRWKIPARKIWQTLGRYVRGLTLIAFIDAVLTGLALWLIGVPMVWAIMAVTFIAAFIPLVGPIIAMAAGGIVALASGTLTDVLFVVLAGIGVQIIEGWILHPIVFSRSVNIHPVAVLAGVAIGGAVWGIVGALLAVPIAAAIFIVLESISHPEPPKASTSLRETLRTRIFRNERQGR